MEYVLKRGSWGPGSSQTWFLGTPFLDTYTLLPYYLLNVAPEGSWGTPSDLRRGDL